MSKTKQNIPKSERGGYDLWARRPMSGKPQNSLNKKRCRRIERKIRRQEMKKLLTVMVSSVDWQAG